MNRRFVTQFTRRLNWRFIKIYDRNSGKHVRSLSTRGLAHKIFFAIFCETALNWIIDVKIYSQSFLKKYGPNPASFSLFFVLFTKEHKFDYKWKKHKWCAWDSNPGRQDIPKVQTNPLSYGSTPLKSKFGHS